MSRITINELNTISFYQVPKSFHHNPKYIGMKSDSKLAYALLRDLLELSVKNGWVNSNGEIYVKLSRKKLMLRLNIKGKEKITKVMQELKNNGLIEEEQVGLNKCNEIYICTPEDLTELYDDSDLLELTENEKKSSESIENKGGSKIELPGEISEINGGSKIELPEVRKSNFKRFENRTHTNTNYTNTKFSSSSSQKREDLLISYFEDNICKLKKTTKGKFLKFISKENDEYIKSLIDYEAGLNISSWNGFEKGLKNFESQEIHTEKEMLEAIEKFRQARSNNLKSNKKNRSAGIKKLRFNDFEQRDYNYEILEKKLLGYSDEDIAKELNINISDVVITKC